MTTGFGDLELNPGASWVYGEQELRIRKYIADMQAQTQARIAQITSSSQISAQAADAKLQSDLTSRKITADSYLQQRQIAADDARSARELAVQQAIANQDFQVKQAQLELNRITEARNERTLQAQMSANPADIISYEFYKRSLGIPTATAQNPSNQATQAASGFLPQQQQQPNSIAPVAQAPRPTAAPAGTPNYGNPNITGAGTVLGSSTPGGTTSARATAAPASGGVSSLSGMSSSAAQGYFTPASGPVPGVLTPSAGGGNLPTAIQIGTPAPRPPTANIATAGTPSAQLPPVYSDADYQRLAASFYQPSNPGQLYNPNLSGRGVFGSTIESPGALSRQEFGQLSDSELQQLGAFLQGGININGKRVAVDPTDYYKQVQNSWIPTISSGAPTTRYS